MEITSDIQLKGTAWNKAITGLSDIFKTRTHYSLFMLSLAIGIMYDKRIETPEENGEEPKSVPVMLLITTIMENWTFIFKQQFFLH